MSSNMTLTPPVPPSGPTSKLGNIAFDFDGVVHSSPKMRWPAERVDFEPLREAIRRGYAVTIMTCNIPSSVGALLEKHGFKVYVDHKMAYARWTYTNVILVTNRKVSAVAYVDDRAIRWEFGADPRAIWDAAELVRPSILRPRSWHKIIRHISGRQAA